jgi:hypothetical protein
MARKLRKEIDKTARCENGHEFPVKQEYVGHAQVKNSATRTSNGCQETY